VLQPLQLNREYRRRVVIRELSIDQATANIQATAD
jgi:hypothetical protein